MYSTVSGVFLLSLVQSLFLQIPLLSITWIVGSFFFDSLTAHLCMLLGDELAAIFSAVQSICLYCSGLSVLMFLHSLSRAFTYREL